MASHDFEAKLAASWPVDDWIDLTVVVAVSGGTDSIALLRGLHALRSALIQDSRSPQGRLIVAHVNHRLRGAESDADGEFVRDTANQLQLPCEVIAVSNDLSHSTRGDGIEAAAREARYALLERTAGKFGARFVVTAHTADDQAETILHRIIRGTGLRGLTGMSRARRLGCATLLRPLLTVRRDENIAYLSNLGQSSRYDSSNDKLQFTRNRIRRSIIPLIEETTNADFVDALRRLASLAGEAQSVIDEQVELAFDRHVVIRQTDEVQVTLAALAKLNRHVVRELFSLVWRRQDWPMQAMGFDEWELLAAMAIDGRPLAATLPGAIEARITAGILTLRKT